MIRLFTKNLPFDLSRKLFFEYSDKEKIVRRIVSEKYHQINEDQYEMITIILAMGIFNTQVLLPISNANSFSGYLGKKGVRALSVSGYSLDSEENKRIGKALSHFGHIASNFKLKNENLNISNMRNFVALNSAWISE